MKHCIVVAMVVVFGVSQVWGQGGNLFTACVEKTGSDFAKARDQYLAVKPEDALLKDKGKSTAWAERLAAHILVGWVANDREYRELLAEKKVMNQVGVEFFAWLRNLGAIEAKHAPLCYELLFKETDTPVTTMDAAEALAALSHKDYPLDVALCHEFLRDAKVQSQPARTAAAWLIRSLPAKLLKKDDLVSTLTVELTRPKQDVNVVKSLLQALAVAADSLEAKDRDILAQNVTKLKGLRELVGEAVYAHAVGDIGGDTGAQVAITYLEGTSLSIEKHWALEALGRSGSPMARSVLVKYVKDQKTPNTLQAAAIRGLGDVPFNNEIGSVIADIIQDNKFEESNQLRAVKALDAQFEKNSNNPKVASTIFLQMNKLGDAGDLRPAVRKSLSATIEAAKRRMK